MVTGQRRALEVRRLRCAEARWVQRSWRPAFGAPFHPSQVNASVAGTQTLDRRTLPRPTARSLYESCRRRERRICTCAFALSDFRSGTARAGHRRAVVRVQHVAKVGRTAAPGRNIALVGLRVCGVGRRARCRRRLGVPEALRLILARLPLSGGGYPDRRPSSVVWGSCGHIRRMHGDPLRSSPAARGCPSRP